MNVKMGSGVSVNSSGLIVDMKTGNRSIYRFENEIRGGESGL